MQIYKYISFYFIVIIKIMSDKQKKINKLLNIKWIQKGKNIPEASKQEINDNFEIVQKCIQAQHPAYQESIEKGLVQPLNHYFDHTKRNAVKYDSDLLCSRLQVMWSPWAQPWEDIEQYRRIEPIIKNPSEKIQKDNETVQYIKINPSKLPKDLVIDFLQYHLELPTLTPLQRKDSKVDYYVPTLLSFDPDLSEFKSYIADATRLDYNDPDYEDFKITSTPRVLTLPSGKILLIAHHDFTYENKETTDYFTKLYTTTESYRQDQQRTIEKIQATLDWINAFKDDFETNFENIKAHIKSKQREDTMQERIDHLTSQNHYILTIKWLLEKIQNRTNNVNIDYRKVNILKKIKEYVKTATTQMDAITKQLDINNFH